MDQNNIKITPPNISEDTLKEMKAFFAKTSIPRIEAEKALKQKGGEKIG
ncbi:hypothetical protein [Mesobacillus jeotgali]|nr:hypothetical protein [Mesobacillus jeotgali]